jgi:hypothetical protein
LVRGFSIGGDRDQVDYEECSEVSEEVSRLYNVERIPEGAERLELAESLEACWADVGVVGIKFDPSEDDESRMLAEAIQRLGHEGGDQALLDDPRFNVILACLDAHLLLFPAGSNADERRGVNLAAAARDL